MRIANTENLQRYYNVISALQDIAKSHSDVSLAVTSEDDPYKDAIAYLMLPDAVQVSKPMMHAIYTACFAADVCEMTSTSQHRISFIVRDVWQDGEEIPAISDL